MLNPQLGIIPYNRPRPHDHTNVGQGGILSYLTALNNKPFIDVREYGAVDNPAVDSATPFQDAVDALLTASPLGGTIYMPHGRYLINTPINPYNNISFDINGDVAVGYQSPMFPVSTVNFIGEEGTILINGGTSIFEPDAAVPQAYLNLNFEKVRFIGNGAGVSIDLDRNDCSPLYLNFLKCVFSNFQYGYSYNPWEDGGANPRNGFVHFMYCLFGQNEYGAKIGADNALFDKCFFQSNSKIGLWLKDVVDAQIRGGKFQYNGTDEDATTTQIKIEATNRNIAFKSVYFEGGSSSNEADNKTHGQSVCLIGGRTDNLTWEDCYYNGLRAESVLKATYCKLSGLKYKGCTFHNFQLNANKEFIQVTSGVTGWLTKFKYDNNEFLDNYDNAENLIRDFVMTTEMGAAIPTKGLWDREDIVLDRTPTEGEILGWRCINRVDTQMRVQAIAAATIMEVDSTAGMLAGDQIGIILDNGNYHWTTIASITDADTLVITAGIPAGRTADVDADVFTMRWRSFSNISLEESLVWNPANCVNGASVSAAIGVTGAALGDTVKVYPPYDLQGMTCSGYVNLANTITVVVENLTGGAIDLANGTWRVKVYKY